MHFHLIPSAFSFCLLFAQQICGHNKVQIDCRIRRKLVVIKYSKGVRVKGKKLQKEMAISVSNLQHSLVQLKPKRLSCWTRQRK